MCILCVIQKWSRRVATMLPWLVIPLIGLWALSQLLPPAFRFEITSPRLACVLVLLITLFWYEILMPQLSAWRARRNARLRERKRLEAIEMQKLRKTATRRCRNCLTPYKDQNPGGGKFMCSYCGHISKRPVLDLPVPPGMGSNSGILKDLVGKRGKILNGKVWSDNGWMCGQDWLENGNCVGGSFSGKPSYWTNGGGFFGGDDHCLAEKSYSRVFIFACKTFTAFFLSIMWLWRKIFRISSPRDDASTDAERRGVLDKRGDNAGNSHESKGEKARRKAEEKRQARLEKELLEEEERKQREEVARLVEERRRLRDEKLEAERGKGSPTAKERESKRETEKKLHERKKERDRTSSKSNSDAEELDKRASKENERNRKIENDRLEHHRTGTENVKLHGTDIGHGYKGVAVSHHNKGNAGSRYFDRMKGSILSSSRAFTGGGFFGRGANVSSVQREHKPNSSVDHFQIAANRRDVSQLDRATGKSYVNGDDNKNSINRPVLIEPQTCTAPKKSWQQLFTRSTAASPPSNTNVISRPSGKSQSEVRSPPFPDLPPSTQTFDNPINFGLQSPFSLPSFSFGSASNSTSLSLSSEDIFPRIGEPPAQLLPEESEIFEDPCYVPDPVSLLGPVCESLENFQLDRGMVGDTRLEKPCAIKNMHAPSEANKPSPIESPISRLRIPEERHPTSSLFPTTSETQDVPRMSVDGLYNANETGTWQMWSSSPLGPDNLGLLGGPASWFSPQELNGSKKEDTTPPAAHKTMDSLFSKDDQGLPGAYSLQKGFLGNCQNGGTFNSVPVSAGDPWRPMNMYGPSQGSKNHYSVKLEEEVAQNGTVYGIPQTDANSQFDMSKANHWAKKEYKVQGSGGSVGNSWTIRPPIGGLYSTQDVQSLWSF